MRRSAAVTRSRAGRAAHCGLRRSARICSRAATAKTKTKTPATATAKTKTPATSGIPKKKTQATAGMLKRKEPDSASSEGAGTGRILPPSELLKLKKKAYKAKYLWLEREDPGALERWKAEAEEAKAEEAQPKKRKKLVIKRLPEMLITVMKTQSYLIKPISDEKLAELEKRSYGFTETYRMRKFIDDKMYAYEQALINQHTILGYAEDVWEVTDDEQE